MYIDEKLSNLDKRSRRIAEKRITDVLFEAEMSFDLPETGGQRSALTYSHQSMQQPFVYPYISRQFCIIVFVHWF